MEIQNHLSPFHELPISITLCKINRFLFGNESVELTTKNKLYDFLISPLETIFLEVKTDSFEHQNLYEGDIVIIERDRKLRVDGLAVIRRNDELKIAYIQHDKDFNTFAIENDKKLLCGIDFILIGTITYKVVSDEEDYFRMLGEDLFKVY